MPLAAKVERRSAFDALVPAWPDDSEDCVKPEPVRCELRCKVLMLVFPVLCGVLVVCGFLIARAASGEPETQELSSCRTAMRGVDFCVPTEFLGELVEVASVDECCSLCDATEGCAAWTFAEGNGDDNGHCLRMRFTEAPCKERPGHVDCRCHTSPIHHGGFKPVKGDIIWHGSD
jgi:hypothetical protein